MTRDGPEIPVFSHEGKTYVEGTAVVADTRALLFVGSSGSGKSGLALSLIALGAKLVGDDRVDIEVSGKQATLSPPAMIKGKIEARSVGILSAETSSGKLCAVVDLDSIEEDRLPPRRICTIAGVDVPLIHKVESGYFSAALWQYLKHGRTA